MFLLSNCQTTSSKNTNSNCFVVINNGVMVLNSNSAVPIKTSLSLHMTNDILHITKV